MCFVFVVYYSVWVYVYGWVPNFYVLFIIANDFDFGIEDADLLSFIEEFETSKKTKKPVTFSSISYRVEH